MIFRLFFASLLAVLAVARTPLLPDDQKLVNKLLEKAIKDSGVDSKSIVCNGTCELCDLDEFRKVQTEHPEVRPLMALLISQQRIPIDYDALRGEIEAVVANTTVQETGCKVLSETAKQFCYIRRENPHKNPTLFDDPYLNVYILQQIRMETFTEICEKEVLVHPNPKDFEAKDTCGDFSVLAGDICDGVVP